MRPEDWIDPDITPPPPDVCCLVYFENEAFPDGSVTFGSWDQEVQQWFIQDDLSFTHEVKRYIPIVYPNGKQAA